MTASPMSSSWHPNAREPHDAPVGDVMIRGGRSGHIKAPHELLQLLLVGGGLHLVDNINYYLFAWAHVIDATYVNRRVGAMQPYAEK